MFKPRLGIFALFALLAGALSLASCGSSSKTTVTTGGTQAASTTVSTTAPATLPTVTVHVATGTPLSTAAWHAQAERICARLNSALNAVKVKTVSELEASLPQAAANERTEVAELSKLVPPASKAKDWEQFLTDSLRWAEVSDELAKSAGGPGTLKTPLAIAARSLHEHFALLIRHDGFRECSFV